LDGICTYMVQIEQRKLHYFRGGFGTFHAQVVMSHEEFDKRHAKVMRQIQDLKRQGKSNEQVDNWIKDEIRHGRIEPEILERRRDYVVNFPFKPPTTELRDGCVIKLDGVAFNYPNGPTLFENVSCALWTDSRITLCGPNGIGKSTLLNLMTGLLEPVEGVITLNRQVRIGRYNQHFVDKLPLEKTGTEYIQSLGVNDVVEARKLLGSFGLEGIVHNNQIATLSGGQKARVALAAISAESPHFLLMDEPTNHLDLESIDALCRAIKDFRGGVLVVTHDARLIEETGMTLWVAGKKNVKPFNGGLSEYKKYVRDLFEKEEAAKELERQQKAASKAESRALKVAGLSPEEQQAQRALEVEKQRQADFDALADLDRKKALKKEKKDKPEKEKKEKKDKAESK